MNNKATLSIDKQDFVSFVNEIKSKILSSQYEALKAVNKELINLYWDIGKNIVEKQEKYGWGKSVVKNLSDELQKDFVGMKGFSVQNLWNMRQFYLEYYKNDKLQPLVGEISWTKNVIIFQKCKDNLEREFYIKTTIKFGMNSTAIKVSHLTKIYKLYDKPIDRLKESLHPFKKQYHKDFYALNDVSFEVKKGETVGIIGKNGAGKSTLLKIITGVLTPTSGSVHVNGRIASLLELGAF